MRESLSLPVQPRETTASLPKENKMTPPNQVLELIERFERYLDEYKRPNYKEVRVRGE